MTDTYQMNRRGHKAMIEQYNPSTMVFATLTPDMHISQEQLAMLETAYQYPIVYEDDCPELSPAMVEAFRNAARIRDMK